MIILFWHSLSFIILYLNCKIFLLFFNLLFFYEIYLLEWNVLQVRDDDFVLPYWLSNTSALLCLLQRNLRSNGFLTAAAQRHTGSSGLTSRIGHVSYQFQHWNNGISCMRACVHVCLCVLHNVIIFL